MMDISNMFLRQLRPEAVAALDADMEEATWAPTSNSTTPSFVPDHYDFEETFIPRIVITKVVSLLSAMGSAYIIYSMLANKHTKLKRTYDRMLLCLCVADLISSLSLFFGSWAVPKNPPPGFEEVYGGPGYWDEMHPTAVGNKFTCGLQGYTLLIGSVSSILFTASIAISFLLQVRFQFREKQMRVAEYIFLGVSTVYPFVASIFVFADRGFNAVRSGFCFIAPDPFICSNPALLENDGIREFCENDDTELRGQNTRTWYVWFCTTPILFTFGTIIVCMGMLFWSVRTQEQRVARWSTSAANGRHTKRVFIKSLLYVTAFMIVWLPNNLQQYVNFPRAFLHYIGPVFLPLQGILNVLIYSDFFNIFKERTVSLQSSFKSSIRSSSSYIGKKLSKSGSSMMMSTRTSNTDAAAGLKSSSFLARTSDTNLQSSSFLATGGGSPRQSTTTVRFSDDTLSGLKSSVVAVISEMEECSSDEDEDEQPQSDLEVGLLSSSSDTPALATTASSDSSMEADSSDDDEKTDGDNAATGEP